MVAAEAYQEIPAEDPQPPPPSKWRRVGIATSVLAVTGLFGAGAASRANARQGPVQVPVRVPSLRQTDLPVVSLDEYNDPTCLRNTGGTCAFWGCNADRGPTDCVYWSPGLTHLGEHGHYCMCQPGFCAALDGKCYPNNNNTLVASRVAIRNAQWMDHHIYIRGWDVYVDNDVPSDRGLWNVYAIPDFTGQPPSNFMIMNVDYPDFALTMEHVCHTHTHRPDTCHYEPKISWMFKMDAEWITMMHTAPWMTQAYTMANMQYANKFFSCQQLTWDVTATTNYGGPPGPMSYWIFDPPLAGPAPLPGGFR